MEITNVWNNTAALSNGTLSKNFNTGGGYIQVFFTGSAYSGSGAAMVGVNLLITNDNVGAAKVYANEQSSHKSLVPMSHLIKLSAGTHTASISPATTQTRIDQNDVFTLVITELSFS